MSTETPTLARIEEDESPWLIAGLSERLESPTSAAAQWEQFASHLGNIPGQKEPVAYGVCSDADDGKGIEYLCGVEVSETEDLPEDFSHKRLPAHTYAVFAHEGHVSTLRQTIDAIWNEWFPASDFKVDETADFFFERYGEQFDPQTGTGDIEVWVPIEA